MEVEVEGATGEWGHFGNEVPSIRNRCGLRHLCLVPVGNREQIVSGATSRVPWITTLRG